MRVFATFLAVALSIAPRVPLRRRRLTPTGFWIVRTDRVFMNIFAFESVAHDVKIADSTFDPPRSR